MKLSDIPPFIDNFLMYWRTYGFWETIKAFYGMLFEKTDQSAGKRKV